ncbi:hypothetical protein KKB55_20850 [Myxococcota bacterium]|nr:hypothetical protein [Myxococcota bacterium]
MSHKRPSDEELARYFDGLLSYEEEATLSASHHEEISALEWLLNGLSDVVMEDAPAALKARAEALWPKEVEALEHQSVLTLLIHWISGQLEAISPAPMLMGGLTRGVRGEALSYQFTVGSIPLEVDLEADGPEQFALYVRPIQAPPSGTLLQLCEGGQIKAMSSLTREGVQLTALPIGAYELSLERAAERLGALQIQLQRA